MSASSRSVLESHKGLAEDTLVMGGHCKDKTAGDNLTDLRRQEMYLDIRMGQQPVVGHRRTRKGRAGAELD